jgi:hypothetical protein
MIDFIMNTGFAVDGLFAALTIAVIAFAFGKKEE